MNVAYLPEMRICSVVKKHKSSLNKRAAYIFAERRIRCGLPPVLGSGSFPACAANKEVLIIAILTIQTLKLFVQSLLGVSLGSPFV